MAPAMSSGGCGGCKQTMTEISLQAVKQAQEEVAHEGSMHQQSANNRGTGPIWEPELPEDRRPPKPLGILLVCTNKSELGSTWDINNRMPKTKSQMRFQVLLKTDRGWFTVGSYNPNRIRGVYWDGSFWSSIAQDGERNRDTPIYIENAPFNAQEWQWSRPDIQWLTGITHNVDRETFFSSVQTTGSARYYMYNHNPGGQAGSAWWKELSYTEPGMRIVGLKFRIRLEGKEYIFYACPPPGVLDSGHRAGEAVWESQHNQAAKSTAHGFGHEIPVAFSGYHMRRPPVLGSSAFTPIFVRTDPRYWEGRRGNVGSSSIAASVFTDVAVSFVGIPYQWGGKTYLMLASTVDYDPRSRTGTQGFGLDCSGFVYCALSRTATLYGFYPWITTENRLNFGVHRIMARSDRLRGHSWMQRGDLFCRPQIGDRAAHVAIYLGYGAAIPGSINYNVVECASDGQVEGCVIRDLPSSSTYDPYRLRF